MKSGEGEQYYGWARYRPGSERFSLRFFTPHHQENGMDRGFVQFRAILGLNNDLSKFRLKIFSK
jgi:hypothetical protein